MKTRASDLAWHLLRSALVDVLNPLLIIALALYVSLGYILTRFVSFTIDHWLALFWLCVALPVLPLILRARRLWRDENTRREGFRWRKLLPLTPMILLLPALISEISSPTLQVLHHGDVHLAFIHQLLYGATPIESAFIAGYPPMYHWLYHAALTPLVSISGFSPPSVAALVTMVALGGSLIWIGQCLDALGIGRGHGAIRGFMILLVYFSINLTAALSLLSHFAAGTFAGFSNEYMLLPGANEHLHSLLKQVLNFNSVSLGLLLFSAALYAGLRIAKDQADAMTLVLFSAAGIGALAVREIAALYIVCGIFGGYALALLLEWLRARRSLIWVWRELTGAASPRFIGLWLALSLALSLPLVQYNLDIAGSFDAGKPYGLSIPNLRMIAAALLLYLPLFALNFRFVWQAKDRARCSLQYGCAIATGLTFALTLPDANQTKGVYFLGLLMALTALCSLSVLRQGKRRIERRIGRVILWSFALLLTGQIAYVSANLMRDAALYAESGFRYRDRHIEHSEDIEGRLAGYLWLRDNTGYDAIVALPIVDTVRSNLFHERQMYLRLLHQHFATSAIDTTERLHHVGLIYDRDSSEDEYREIVGRMENELPGRALYAVMKESEVSMAQMLERGAELVFDGGYDAAHVYWLNPD